MPRSGAAAGTDAAGADRAADRSAAVASRGRIRQTGAAIPNCAGQASFGHEVSEQTDGEELSLLGSTHLT